MASGLLEVMKLASQQANEAGQPTDLRIGTVTSVNPLKVQVSSQFTLPSTLLIVPQHLTDYKVKVKVDWDTETANLHTHKVSGDKTITICNALKVGDKVAMLRKQGGQSYLILDRI